MILQHVHQCVPDLARAGERAAMPPISPESPAPKQKTVHAARHANHEPAYAGRQLLPAFSLDDQMHMVVLNRVVSEAKTIAIASTQRAEHCLRNMLATQRTE